MYNFYRLLLFIFLSTVVYTQPLVQNMYLLKNLNEHSGAGAYSAIWGYVDSTNGREYAILGCWNGTSFIDVTDSANIHEVDFLPGFESCCREMKVYSHYAYITADGTLSPSGVQIVDLQYLPDSIHYISTFLMSGFTKAHTIQQYGPYLYVNGGDYKNGGTFILDLTQNPEQPVKRGDWETWYVHDCRVLRDTIYAAIILNNGTQGNGSVTVIDATDKDNPHAVAAWINNPQPGPHNTAVSLDGNYCYVTDEINGYPRLLKIWDISDLDNALLIATWQPTGIESSTIHNVELYSDYLIAAHYTAGIRVVNVKNPHIPIEAGWYDTYPQNNNTGFEGCWGVYLMPSGKIIASDRSTGLYVVKTTFPMNIAPEINVPKDFYLGQNYPNPFNPNTTINFGITKAGHVTLKVYDLLGRHVSTIIDAFLSPQNYTINFSSSHLPTGVYFYKLTQGEKEETKKMAIIK